jgi:hypothetical protein
MSDANRQATLTTLLADDAALRRLVVSWPLVAKELNERAAVAEWARVAGVARTRVERAAVVLFRHGVCRPDRSVDPEASRIVAHFAAETLRAAQRRTR